MISGATATITTAKTSTGALTWPATNRPSWCRHRQDFNKDTGQVARGAVDRRRRHQVLGTWTRTDGPNGHTNWMGVKKSNWLYRRL